MSEARLERIRTCEHGEWNVHALDGTILNEDGSIDRDKVCRGAVRREITVDYAEAWKQLQGRDELRDAGRLPHSPRETELAVRAIVDAALGRGDTREDKE